MEVIEITSFNGLRRKDPKQMSIEGNQLIHGTSLLSVGYSNNIKIKAVFWKIIPECRLVASILFYSSALLFDRNKSNAHILSISSAKAGKSIAHSPCGSVPNPALQLLPLNMSKSNIDKPLKEFILCHISL